MYCMDEEGEGSEREEAQVDEVRGELRHVW
jgi:hypothetical protein